MSKKLTSEQLDLLKATKSMDDWNTACGIIKNANGGDYPSDWWQEVMSSGLANKVMASWEDPSSAELTAATVDLGDLQTLDLSMLPPGSMEVIGNLPEDQLAELKNLMTLLMSGGLQPPPLQMPKMNVPMVYPSNEMEFALTDILSVTLGFLFDGPRGMEAPHSVMHFMMGGGPALTGNEMQTFVLSVSEAIYQQHPALRELEVELPKLRELIMDLSQDVSPNMKWVKDQEAKYGAKLKLKFTPDATPDL